MKGKIIRSIAGFYDVVPEAAGSNAAARSVLAEKVQPAEGSREDRLLSSSGRESDADTSDSCGPEAWRTSQEGTEIYRCRAKGIFRARKQKPLVGDDVEFEITDTVSDPMEGNVTELLPRRNQLVRPYVANVDQACLVFAITDPAPSFNMLDRFLISVQNRHLPAILCFNKEDLASAEQIQQLRDIYEACGCRVLFLAAKDTATLEPLRDILAGRTTVICGPSGAGKSTLINQLVPGGHQETGELSRKIARGKNTTRTVELLMAGPDTYLIDTPGFTSLYLEDIEAEDVKHYYPEFAPYAPQCRFQGCNHVAEPDCAVKAAVRKGGISSVRYQNYTEIYQDLKERKPVYR